MVCRHLAGHRLGGLLRPLRENAGATEGTAISTSPTGTTWHSSSLSPFCISSTISRYRFHSPRPRATLYGRGCRTLWCSGGMATTLSPFFLTAGFLAMLYYYLPKRAERPIFSYRLSILSFWGITFFYMWAGSHHLHYTALPHWVQNLGMTFSVMLTSTVLGFGRERPADAQWRVAQGARRRDPALYDDGGVFLRSIDVRRVLPRHTSGEFPVALHRLDGGPCACGRAGMGRHDHIRVVVYARAIDLEARADVLRSPR